MYFFYLVCILVLGLLLKSKKIRLSSRGFLFAAFFGMTLLAGFRGETVGTDTETYHLILDRMISYGFENYKKIWDIEPGFAMLVILVSKTVKNMQWLFVLFAGFTSYAFARFIYKHSRDVFFSTLLYYLFIFPRTLNICRMYIAISFFLLAYDCILNKEKLKALLLIFAATLFHQSAWILVIVWVLTFVKKIDEKIYIELVLCAGFLYAAFDIVLPKVLPLFGRYTHYLTGPVQYQSSLSWKYALVYGIVFLFSVYAIYVLHWTRKKKIKDGIVVSKYEMALQEDFIMSAGFFVWSIMFLLLSQRFFLMDRFFDYFYFSFIVIVPNSIEYGFNYKSTVVLKLGLGILLTYAGMNSILANIAGVYPYIFCF